MKDLFVLPKRAFLLLVVVVLVLLQIVPGASARVLTWGGGDVPFYARIQREHMFYTDEWAVIAFYRPPECVPDDFNLLDFFNPAAFGCTPPTTDGFTLWEGEPGISNPMAAQLHGLGAVPVWFVAWPELQAAIADDVLTVPELEGMPSLLIGSAGFYKETLHPVEGAVVPMINMEAHGLLEDGRSLHVRITVVVGAVENISIEFE
jgi:hypothetical protein